MRNVPYFLMILFIMTSCKYSTYTIKKGKHYSKGLHFSFAPSSELKISVKFNDSSIYQTKDPANQADVNKLIGFSDCLSHHHTNSARLGWRWYHEELQILAYVYNQGERYIELIDSIKANQNIAMSIKAEDYDYIFQVNDIIISIPRHCSGKPKGYFLYPYFGGDEVAPHDITLTIMQR